MVFTRQPRAADGDRGFERPFGIQCELLLCHDTPARAHDLQLHRHGGRYRLREIPDDPRHNDGLPGSIKIPVAVQDCVVGALALPLPSDVIARCLHSVVVDRQEVEIVFQFRRDNHQGKVFHFRLKP